MPLLQPTGLKILIEPGRFIVGNAGILVTRVEYVKQTGRKNFIIVDAAMNDLIRPAFYDSYHEIVPVKQRGGRLVSSDVVGPICESAIIFARTARCRRWGRAIIWRSQRRGLRFRHGLQLQRPPWPPRSWSTAPAPPWCAAASAWRRFGPAKAFPPGCAKIRVVPPYIVAGRSYSAKN